MDLLGERWRREAAVPGDVDDAAVTPPPRAPTPAPTPGGRPEVPLPPETQAPHAEGREPPEERPETTGPPTSEPSFVWPHRAAAHRRPRRWIAGALAAALVGAAVVGVLLWRGGRSFSTKIVETFSDPSDSWFLPVDYGDAAGSFRDGGYLARIKQDEGWLDALDDFDPQKKGAAGGPSALAPSDAKLTVDATKLRGTGNHSFGLTCSNKAAGTAGTTYYYLEISSDGYAGITKHTPGKTRVLRDWNRAPAIRRGSQTNTLVGECRGGRGGQPVRLKLVVNGREVARATDRNGVPVTFFGFHGGADRAGLEVLFDNFSLERL